MAESRTATEAPAWASLLKARRAALGWSQRELAQRAGVHQPQVAKAERGDDLQLSVLARIAAPLGLRPSLADQLAPPGMQSVEEDDIVQQNLESWRHTWPEVDPHVFAVLARLWRLGHHIEHGLETVAGELGMRGGDVMVLGALRRKGAPFESTPTGLKHLLWITLPGLKKRLDKLVELGMVKRVDNPLDRRGQAVRMTPRGHQALDRLIAHPAPAFLALQVLPSAELRVLSDCLGHVLRQLEGSASG
jgi:DNA-binding MarR family transcriptional regulator